MDLEAQSGLSKQLCIFNSEYAIFKGVIFTKSH